MFLLYFLLETPVGVPDVCPYRHMYIRTRSSLEEGLNSNIKYQNCNLYVEKEIWKDFLIRIETQYNQPIQSSGIVQNNQMICIKFIIGITRKFCPF